MRHTAGFTWQSGPTALHKAYPGGSGNVAASMKAARSSSPRSRSCRCTTIGTTWDYSYGLDIVGLAIGRSRKQPLGACCRIASSARSG